MGNRSSTASNESNSTFDKAMCQRFNAFYDVVPLPEGRVRPKFECSEPHLALVARSKYASYKTEYINSVKRDQITDEVNSCFIKLFAQFEPFPTPLAGCLTNTTLKQLKQQNSDEFNEVQTYDKKTDTPSGFYFKFTLIRCKLTFLGFIVEYVTQPVVLEWDKYMKEKQGQSLSPEDEKQLSILLQIKLLEGMDKMIEKTKGNAIDEYVPTDEEIKNYETLKNKLIALQREREPQFQEAPNQQERDKLEKARDELEEASFPLGGGSKYKRQSKRRKQRNQQKRRQKSKKYCK
jgi:hypothetical protein